MPEHLRQAPVLDDAAAAQLTALGVQIEQLYGQPMDIEWAWADGRSIFHPASAADHRPAHNRSGSAADLAKTTARRYVRAHQLCRANTQPGFAAFRHAGFAHGRHSHPGVIEALYQGQDQLRLCSGQWLCVHGRRAELP